MFWLVHSKIYYFKKYNYALVGGAPEAYGTGTILPGGVLHGQSGLCGGLSVFS